jgi:hypothetical protein
LNWSRSQNTLERPRLSRTTVRIFFDQAVDARVVVGVCVVILSVASVFTGDEPNTVEIN